MKINLLVIIAATFFIGAACTTPTAPDPPHATPVVKDSELCSAAQDNLTAQPGTPMALANGDGVGCAVGKPTKKGKPFAQFCHETQISGIFINPKCLAGAKSCSEAADCKP